MGKEKAKFEWDEEKDAVNREKHGVSFALAQYAFADPQRVILKDMAHSQTEERYYCLGEVAEGIWIIKAEQEKDSFRVERSEVLGDESPVHEAAGMVQG